MNTDVLERVLACKALPTLPAVALRVVELSQQRNVATRELADLLSHDPALCAKVLKTVNSSLYGLRQPCSSINQAVVMLGLPAVKSLALGFSLVGAIRDASGQRLDMAMFWRRSLYAAIAAKGVATSVGLRHAEECFIAGLLQDIGVLALHLALGDSYDRIIAPAGNDHRLVARLELAAFATQHPEVGARLLSRWKLPAALVMPVRYHERPTAAPQEHAETCRAVALGNVAADLMTTGDGGPMFGRFCRDAEQWFGLTTDSCQEVLGRLSEQVRDAARLLQVPTGTLADSEEIVAGARRQLAALDLLADDTTRGAVSLGLSESEFVDDLTGIANQRRLDQAMIAAVEQSAAGGVPMALAVCDIDDLDRVRSEFGIDAHDTILIAMAGRLGRALSAATALVCREEGGRFAIVMPRTDRATALRIVRQAQDAVSREAVNMIAAPKGTPRSLPVSMSVGLVALESESVRELESPAEISRLARQAALTARATGQNAMSVYTPVRRAA